MPKLTVLIPCKDERRHIRACIESVRDIADEILVADSGSTDGTLDIVREVGGCRIIEREYINSANFKNWAIPQAENDWVLVVDSDERVTPELAAEIKAILEGEPEFDGYSLNRANDFLGHSIKYCGMSTASLVRLFRRDVCTYLSRRVHANVEVSTGKVGKLKSKLVHHTCVDLDHFIQRQHRYSTWASLDWNEKGRKSSFYQLFTHSFIRFWQLYLIRGGILDGKAGLVVCSLIAYYTFLKEAKLWAYQDVRALDDVEPHEAGNCPAKMAEHHARRAA
ncbi:glycosyl transferase family 2 [Pirellula staleyi DSM 6068]|uniref:Glycosyl transferase family 2 n=1 Tax=Pirellula staleyi (strain ATCC 27377 / DSM 6068 / ICPB 4128) TaxID=530564 RepID=D2R1V3_PIRSD|nr:glycosyltransferase family 2 protein [Pirellula staleyi]ADB16822.1 glycosyl transferase family 2 [Pirellula staleyi DSM 6068]